MKWHGRGDRESASGTVVARSVAVTLLSKALGGGVFFNVWSLGKGPRSCKQALSHASVSNPVKPAAPTKTRTKNQDSRRRLVGKQSGIRGRGTREGNGVSIQSKYII